MSEMYVGSADACINVVAVGFNFLCLKNDITTKPRSYRGGCKVNNIPGDQLSVKSVLRVDTV